MRSPGNDLEKVLRRLSKDGKWVDVEVVLRAMGITLGDLVDLVAKEKDRFEFDYSDMVVKRVGLIGK